ncbi:NADPH-Fe(3+) oxidoreductase subunit beta [subsurface metagenome]
MGYQVEIIEASPEPGGMLRWAIPSFRLPKHILDRDIRYLEKMGVIIKTDIKFGVDVSLSDVRKGGANAVIIAIGTHQSLALPVANAESFRRYMDCLTFLKKYANGEPVDLGKKVVVVGAGNSGIDAARAALRCGAKEATMIDVLDSKEIACDKDEMKEAEEEGVKVSYLTTPVRIIGKAGEIQGLECRIADKQTIVMDATSIIVAIGQHPDFSWNKEGLAFKLSPKNTLIVEDSQTNIEGVFAAGDVVNGPTTVVEAMAGGKKAASAVGAYLCGEA